jgi:hypothetical protein
MWAGANHTSFLAVSVVVESLLHGSFCVMGIRNFFYPQLICNHDGNKYISIQVALLGKFG